MHINSHHRNFIKFIIIASIITIFDLISKELILSYLEDIAITNNISNPKIELLPFLNIIYVLNRGISFGMFSNIDNAQFFLSLLQGSITMVIIYILYKSKDNYNNFAYAIIIGGALGNVIDRIVNGGVVDFIDLYYHDYHWPAFNVADSSIFIGVMLIIFKELLMNKNKND